MGWDREADFVVIGTGAGGATAGFDLAMAGEQVLFLEEGGWYTRADYRPDFYSAVSRLWRDFGGQAASGRAVFPIAQGCCVGGSTAINTAIMHRLPFEVWDGWARDEGIRRWLPWDDLERAGASLERDLEIQPSLAPNFSELPLSAALRRLGWSYEAMPRAAPGCQGTTRCLQGCPTGGKWSMEASFIPRALAAGAQLQPRCRAERVLIEGGRAVGVEVIAADDAGAGNHRSVRQRIGARRAVLVAAGAVHTPLLLARSRLRSPHLGRHFQCHIGTNVVAEFTQPAADILGPILGCEVRDPSGLKFSSIQSVPLEILLGNVPAVGEPLADLLRRRERLALWNSSMPCIAEGRVGRALRGGASVRLTPSPPDYARVRSSVAQLARLFFAAGATRVYPQVHGAPRVLTDPVQLEAIGAVSLDGRNYTLNCCTSSAPAAWPSPRRRRRRSPLHVHGTERLLVVDASVSSSVTGGGPVAGDHDAGPPGSAAPLE